MEHERAIQKLIDGKFINLASESTFITAFRSVFKCGSVQLAERMLLNDSYSKIEQLNNSILMLHTTVPKITGLPF